MLSVIIREDKNDIGSLSAKARAGQDREKEEVEDLHYLRGAFTERLVKIAKANLPLGTCFVKIEIAF